MDPYDFAGSLSLMSSIAALWATNCVAESRYISYFEHENGTVCPFGINGGKVVSLLAFLQAYYFFNKLYLDELRHFTIIFTYIVFACSFLNSLVMKRLSLFFALQTLIIITICS